VTAVLRFPWLLFAAGVERLRRMPMAMRFGRSVRFLPRILLVVAIVVVARWATEVSPERISLADLVAGKLAPSQSWIIITGDLSDEPGSTGPLHQYRLTDPAVPNAQLFVQSTVAQSLGRTTISGRTQGGHFGVPAGYAWSAQLDADAALAEELPGPWPAAVLGALAMLIVLARRSRYPMFSGDAPSDFAPATAAVRVTASSESGRLGRATIRATLSFTGDQPGAADLRIGSGRPLPVRLHSAFSTVDVGVVHRLSGSAPALRVKAGDDDLTLAFASTRERDAAFAALSAEAQQILEARGLGRASSPQASG
jgi:hypothetical protein